MLSSDTGRHHSFLSSLPSGKCAAKSERGLSNLEDTRSPQIPAGEKKRKAKAKTWTTGTLPTDAIGSEFIQRRFQPIEIPSTAVMNTFFSFLSRTLGRTL